MARFYYDGEEVDIPIKKHSTRVFLEQGGVVDREAFETMLREEAKQEKMDWLESINHNLLQLNKNIYEILLFLKTNNQ